MNPNEEDKRYNFVCDKHIGPIVYDDMTPIAEVIGREDAPADEVAELICNALNAVESKVLIDIDTAEKILSDLQYGRHTGQLETLCTAIQEAKSK